MQSLRVKLMQVKLGIKEYDQSVNLPCTVDEDSFALIIRDSSTRHTPINLS